MSADEIKPSWTWQYIAITILMSAATGFIGYGLKALFEPSSPPDHEMLNRPYLEPTLSLDVHDGDKYYPSYGVVNVGMLPASNIRFTTSAHVCIRRSYCIPQTRGATLRHVGG